MCEGLIVGSIFRDRSSRWAVSTGCQYLAYWPVDSDCLVCCNVWWARRVGYTGSKHEFGGSPHDRE
jgi:hypothetical protein